MVNDTTYSVYRIVCFPTGKCYVGQSKDPEYRRRKHFQALKRECHHSQYMQRSYNKYGVQAFYFEILEHGISSGDINARERYWIARFDSCANGFNGSSGGETVGVDSIPCEWNGVYYESYSAAAQAIGITRDAMAWRIKNGYACDGDMKSLYKRFVQWNGIDYGSLSECAKAIGVTLSTLKKRLDAGYVSDADMQMSHTVSVKWNGVLYKSIIECSKTIGVSPSTLRGRLLRGQTCDDDIRMHVSVACMWNGVQYESYKAAGEALGIDPSTVYDRIKRGWTSDADLPTHAKRKKC